MVVTREPKAVVWPSGRREGVVSKVGAGQKLHSNEKFNFLQCKLPESLKLSGS